MLERFWNWLISRLRQLFRHPPSQQGTTPAHNIPVLSDTAYEFFFLKLLDGVAAGWNQQQVMDYLGIRSLDTTFQAWLKRFGRDTLLAASVLNHELARRMVMLGDLDIGQIGEIAREIGLAMLKQRTSEPALVDPSTPQVHDCLGREKVAEQLTDPSQSLSRQPLTEKIEDDLDDDLLRLARLCLDEGCYHDALAYYDRAIDINPDHFDAWFKRGETFYQLKDYQAAITCYDKVLTLKSNDDRAWSYRGIVLSILGRHEEAIESFDKAISLGADKESHWYNRGVTLSALKRHEEAIKNFDEAIRLKPDYYEAWGNRGIALHILQRLEEAIESYRKVNEITPGEYIIWGSLGNALYSLGRYEEAVSSYDRVIAIKSDDHLAWQRRGDALAALNLYEEGLANYNKALELNPDDYHSWHSRGIALYKLGRYEEAIDSYDKALQIKPDEHIYWSNRGVALRDLGRHEEAISSYEQAIALNPEDYLSLSNQGNLLYSLGRFEEAVVNYEKALKICPSYYQAWHERGSALYSLSRYEEAIESYDRSLSINPDFSVSWYSRGAVLSASGRFEEALLSCDRAISLNPDEHLAWSNRGAALSYLGRYEEAIISCDNALNLKPDDHTAWGNRGLSLSGLRRFEEAILCYDKVLEMQPGDYLAWINRGKALFDLGRYSKAVDSYDRALEVRPDFLDAWDRRGNALHYSGLYEAAIASYDKALAIDPGKSDIWRNRGASLSAAGRYQEALESCDRTLEINPDDYFAWSNRGDVLSSLGFYEEAITCCDKALTLQNTLWQAWAIRGSAASRSLQYLPATSFIVPAGPANSDLNQRGYAGAIACYQMGLGYVLPEEQPEGWGRLHHQMGQAHYFHSWFNQDGLACLQRSVTEYQLALTSLTAEDFPEARLDVLGDLMRATLGLGNIDQANAILLEGLDLFGRLLNAQPSVAQKRRLESRFSSFSQVQVDVLLQSGQRGAALEAAERQKNRRLAWILEEWREQVWSPCYTEMQTLVDDATAVVYWHLSEDRLTTFVLKSGNSEPVLIEPAAEATYQQKREFDDWLKTWRQDYQDYRGKGKEINEHNRQDHPWRTQLQPRLAQLQKILNVLAIIDEVAVMTRLILVPHRELHTLPVHVLFSEPFAPASPFTLTYLPSLQVGLNLQRRQSLPLSSAALLGVEAPTHNGLKDLPYARLEAALVTRLWPQSGLISAETADQATVAASLDSYQMLHFNGHAGFATYPEEAALALAGSDRLTVKAIAALPLKEYRLVNLAACETALSDRNSLDLEYMGLASAFLQAGATGVISSLWAVWEIPSAWLMLRFYQGLTRDHLAPATALLRAQQWLRTVTYADLAHWLANDLLPLVRDDSRFTHDIESEIRVIRNNASKMKSGEPPFADPYHWAAFTFIGKSVL